MELNRSRKTRKVKRIISYILLFFIPILISVGGVYVYNNYISKESKKSKIPSIIKPIETEEPVESVEPYVNELPEVRNNYGNPYIMARIDIPNMNINNYVTRASNNSYYLNYNLYNQYDQIGVPFFDYRNTDLNNDRQINIYAHNTQNEAIYDKLPFINLEKYTDEAIFNTNKDIYLYLDDKKVHYQVIAIKIITTDIEHMKLIYKDDNDYLEHVNKLLANSLYRDTTETITKNDRLLVLQICHYNPMGSYLLTIAKEK